MSKPAAKGTDAGASKPPPPGAKATTPARKAAAQSVGAKPASKSVEAKSSSKPAETKSPTRSAAAKSAVTTSAAREALAKALAGKTLATEPAPASVQSAGTKSAQTAGSAPQDDDTVMFARPVFPDEPSGQLDAQTSAAPPRQTVRATGSPRRPPMLVQGLWPALLAGGLVAATSFGLLPLAVAVLGVQVFLILGALALLDAPASGGAFLVATGAAVAADAVVLLDDGRVSGLAGVIGVGLVASLAHQLARRGRSRVTESLADTLVVLVVAVAAACLLALHELDGGQEVLQVSLAASGAVLLAGRLGDWLAPRPMLALGSTRGWPGLVFGLGAGVAAAALVADLAGDPPLRAAILIGLVVSSTVATADLAVDLGAAELRSGWRDARRVAALRPTALLLPYAVLGPVALLAGRLLLT